MTKIKTKNTLAGVGLLMSFVGYSQQESQTSSPYSLYGLGVVNETSIGKTNALGRSGIALSSETEINNLNPASYATIPSNTFFFDVGIKGVYNNLSNKWGDNEQSTYNFSNLAFAFPLSRKSGIGLTVIPYTEVGYRISGLETNIEGSEEIFTSDITGLGGLTDLKLNYGYAVTRNLRAGLTGSFIFGSIDEKENITLTDSSLEIDEKTSYNGFRLGFGGQFDLSKSLSLGATVQLPTKLQGNLNRTVVKYLDNFEVIVEEDEPDDPDAFKLPLELGLGFSLKALRNLTISGDYKKNLWSQTDQADGIGRYVDQDVYGIGFDFQKDPIGLKYWQRIHFRMGFNYDSGNLSVNQREVEGYSFTFGLGVPFNMRTNSKLNISYAYGQRGQVENILVRENYHLLNINISLEDLWFVKRKYD